MYQQTDPPLPPKEVLPTMYDLPSEGKEDSGLPDHYHIWQADLLEKTFFPPNHPRNKILVASDLNIYYNLKHPTWYKRPDWFAVLGVDCLYEQRESRLSYVIWQEGVAPLIAIELLSPSTEKEDLGEVTPKASQPPTKWEVYERILRIPYYVVFNGNSNKLRLFELVRSSYREVILESAKFWLPEIELGLGLWLGEYQDLNRLWLRWYDTAGNWIPTPVEKEKQLVEQERQRAEVERQRAQGERQRAERERQRAERLAAQLRAMGVEPEE